MSINEFLLRNGPDFDSTVTGTFGSFHTQNSYDVNYLLTSMNYKELEKLKVASEAFEFSQVNFDEMIQREIDTKRVNDEIVGDYLEKDLHKALFFPPIIVSIVAFDDEDKPLHKYGSFEENIIDKGNYKQFEKLWDRHFQIEMPINSQSFDFYKTETEEEIKIHKNAVTLRFDSKIVKLVVIDGQHRYKALREYIDRYDDQKKYLNLPVCICFSPKAIENNGPEDILDTLRNMFVTINNKGKQVSGHYIDLLNDNSLASQTVRALSNKWKSETSEPLESKLQFIEWNQRSNSKARRVNRNHSITTVSMLCESLRKSIFFQDKHQSNIYQILRLSENKVQLESSSSFHISSIKENEFAPEQKEILYKLIDENIIPSLEVLLTKPSVFKYKIDKFHSVIGDFKQKSQSQVSGYRRFIRQMEKFGDVDKKLHSEESKLVSDKFYSQISVDEYFDNYTRLVFNQAYLRLWADIVSSHSLFRENILSFTNCFISALELTAFDKSRNIFSKSRRYNTLMLYKLGKPNTANAGKDSWYDLLTMSLFNPESFALIHEWLIPFEKSSEAESKISQIINTSKNRFINKTNELLLKDIMANWRIKDYPISLRNEIQELEALGNLTDFKSKIIEITENENVARLDLLSSVLGYDIT
jgi:hypothetical protein